MKGPETILLMEIKFGKFKNFSFPTSHKVPSSFLGISLPQPITFPRFPTDANPNPIGKFLTLSKSLGKTTSLPLKYSGVADCESFQAGKQRKSGPEKGIHPRRGEKAEEGEVRRGAKEKGLGAATKDCKECNGLRGGHGWGEEK